MARGIEGSASEQAFATESPSCKPAPSGEPLELFTRAVPPIGIDRPGCQRPELLASLRSRLGLEAVGGRRVYAVIDGAIGLELAMRVKHQAGCRLFTLFEGARARDAAQAGPILVEPPDDPSAFLGCWVDAAGAHLGVLVVAYSKRVELTAHLRHIFVVTSESSQQFFFRFYDPRVLPRFVATCSAQERTDLFGPVRAFIVETAVGGSDEFETLASGAADAAAGR